MNLTIAQDGNGEPIRLVKLFQVAFLNRLRQRPGSIISLYSGIVFEGLFNAQRDAPVLTIDLSSDEGQVVECEDLTGNFGAEIEAIKTFWGRTSGVVSDSSRLREIITASSQTAEIGPLSSLVDAAHTRRAPIYLFGDSRPNDEKILAFPGEVDGTNKRKPRILLRRPFSEIGSLLPTVNCYAWLRQDIRLNEVVIGTTGMEFSWGINFNLASECYDVSHYFVADRRYRILHNSCSLLAQDNSVNSFFGGGVKAIFVQDKTSYFLDWIERDVRTSSIFEIKDKPWFRTHKAKAMSIEVTIEDQIIRQYLVNRVTMVGIGLAALAATGIDQHRTEAYSRYFDVYPASHFLNPTGVWFLMSGVAGWTFLKFFASGANLWSKTIAGASLCLFAGYTSIVFLMSQEMQDQLMGSVLGRWVLIAPGLAIILGLLSWFLTLSEFCRRVFAKVRSRVRKTGKRLVVEAETD